MSQCNQNYKFSKIWQNHQKYLKQTEKRCFWRHICDGQSEEEDKESFRDNFMFTVLNTHGKFNDRLFNYRSLGRLRLANNPISYIQVNNFQLEVLSSCRFSSGTIL